MLSLLLCFVALLCTIVPARDAPGEAVPASRHKVAPSHSKKKTPASGGSESAHPGARRTGGRKSDKGRSSAGKRSSALSKAAAQRNLKIRSAFIASAQLRPMAQQLAATRSPQAYHGVETYARQHTGEAAAAAYLALGHAAALDHRYVDALSAFHQAKSSGEVLDDYADFLAAQAAFHANRGREAYSLLLHFGEQYPDSIFVQNAPVLLANLHLQQDDGEGAIQSLTSVQGSPVSTHADFLFTLARALPGNRKYLAGELPLSGDLPQTASQQRGSAIATAAPGHVDGPFPGRA